MLGRVAGSPRNTAVLVAVRVERAVPAVEHILGQVLGLFEVGLVTRQLIGLDELTDQPLLVVVDVEDAVDLRRTLVAAAVHAVDRPFLGLRERGQGEGSQVVIGIFVELGQQLGVTLEVLVVEFRNTLALLGLQAAEDGVDSLDRRPVHPDAGFLIGTGPRERVVVARHGHAGAFEIAFYRPVDQRHGTRHVLHGLFGRRLRNAGRIVGLVRLAARNGGQHQRTERKRNDFFHKLRLSVPASRGIRPSAAARRSAGGKDAPKSAGFFQISSSLRCKCRLCSPCRCPRPCKRRAPAPHLPR